MAATNGTVVGVFQGASLHTAFPTNPQSLDILQVINEGGTVVWNLTAAGVANVNPASPSKVAGVPQALYKQVFGASLAAGWTNTSNLDLLQVVGGTGGAMNFYVDYLGTVHGTA